VAEDYQRQSALAHLGLAGRAVEGRGDAGIAMGEVPFPCMVNLRGKPKDKAFMAAAMKALSFGLPRRFTMQGKGTSPMAMPASPRPSTARPASPRWARALWR